MENREDADAGARLLSEIDRLRRGLEGAKDWAARSGASGLEQWCSEALKPTGALALFVLLTEPDPRDATIKALADALSDTAPVVGAAGPCWCDPMMEKKNGRHWEAACVSRRAALRLAGRLP